MTMIQVPYDKDGVKGTIYIGNKNECIPWHDHEWVHGHKVLKGKTYVEIEGQPGFHWRPKDGNYEFPIGVMHQITVAEDYTEFLNAVRKAA